MNNIFQSRADIRGHEALYTTRSTSFVILLHGANGRFGYSSHAVKRSEDVHLFVHFPIEKATFVHFPIEKATQFEQHEQRAEIHQPFERGDV